MQYYKVHYTSVNQLNWKPGYGHCFIKTHQPYSEPLDLLDNQTSDYVSRQTNMPIDCKVVKIEEVSAADVDKQWTEHF